MINNKNKRGQEEMVGFALILILVAVIFLVFLASYIKKPLSDSIEDPEITSFIQSIMQYTTKCEQKSENITLNRLIFACQNKEYCSYNTNSCILLNNTLKEIMLMSWNVGEESPTKGYSLIIFSEEGQVLNLSEGKITGSYRGSEQDFGKGKSFVSIIFNAYS